MTLYIIVTVGLTGKKTLFYFLQDSSSQAMILVLHCGIKTSVLLNPKILRMYCSDVFPEHFLCLGSPTGCLTPVSINLTIDVHLSPFNHLTNDYDVKLGHCSVTKPEELGSFLGFAPYWMLVLVYC